LPPSVEYVVMASLDYFIPGQGNLTTVLPELGSVLLAALLS